MLLQQSEFASEVPLLQVLALFQTCLPLQAHRPGFGIQIEVSTSSQQEQCTSTAAGLSLL